MIRVVLPAHLKALINVHGEIQVDVSVPVSQESLLDAIEARYPVLLGTMRDARTRERRAFVRFFACGEDHSHDPRDQRIPEEVESGQEPFYVIGAMAGG